MKTVVIDTNLINAKRKDPVLNKIEKLEMDNKIKIIKTDVMDTEMQKYPQGLAKSKQLIEDRGIAIFGHSRYGHCKFASKNEVNLFEGILRLLFGNKLRSSFTKNEIRDAMNLATFLTHKRDYFVTRDNDFLSKRQLIERNYNATIISPEGLLTIIK